LIPPGLRGDSEFLCARFSPGNDLIATGSRDGTVQLWNAALGKALHQPLRHKGAVVDLAFSPDGQRFATASEDNSAAVWDTATGHSVCDPLRHAFAVSAIAFSPDSMSIATASEDGTAQLWDAATGQSITEPLHHLKPVRCLAFSPDGRTLFSGSSDRTVQAWDVSAPLTRTNRKPLVLLARAISAESLHDSGRLEPHLVEPLETLRARARALPDMPSALCDWFFAETRQRPLTPFSHINLDGYVERRRRENTDASGNDALFYSEANLIPDKGEPSTGPR
jgi:dipeptidyl aminopeptidase/acylaminoacyl peptidase